LTSFFSELVAVFASFAKIGKNYMDHVKEMGGTKALSEPIYFIKPFSSVVRPGEPIVIPAGVGEIHHEVELALVIGSKLKNALPSETMAAVSGFAISLDMTARDMQVIEGCRELLGFHSLVKC
jgi:2-keto-4-pentenoate hydratase/2-oxohepta-3-ene-1,7-dioic acid hydratase in catechol pathway